MIRYIKGGCRCKINEDELQVTKYLIIFEEGITDRDTYEAVHEELAAIDVEVHVSCMYAWSGKNKRIKVLL